jgi:hypothetical protein
MLSMLNYVSIYKEIYNFSVIIYVLIGLFTVYVLVKFPISNLFNIRRDVEKKLALDVCGYTPCIESKTKLNFITSVFFIKFNDSKDPSNNSEKVAMGSKLVKNKPKASDSILQDAAEDNYYPEYSLDSDDEQDSSNPGVQTRGPIEIAWSVEETKMFSHVFSIIREDLETHLKYKLRDVPLDRKAFYEKHKISKHEFEVIGRIIKELRILSIGLGDDPRVDNSVIWKQLWTIEYDLSMMLDSFNNEVTLSKGKLISILETIKIKMNLLNDIRKTILTKYY